MFLCSHSRPSQGFLMGIPVYWALVEPVDDLNRSLLADPYKPAQGREVL